MSLRRHYSPMFCRLDRLLIDTLHMYHIVLRFRDVWRSHCRHASECFENFRRWSTPRVPAWHWTTCWLVVRLIVTLHTLDFHFALGRLCVHKIVMSGRRFLASVADSDLLIAATLRCRRRSRCILSVLLLHWWLIDESVLRRVNIFRRIHRDDWFLRFVGAALVETEQCESKELNQVGRHASEQGCGTPAGEQGVTSRQLHGWVDRCWQQHDEFNEICEEMYEEILFASKEHEY